MRIVSEEADARWTLDLFEVELVRLGDDFFSLLQGFHALPQLGGHVDQLMQRRFVSLQRRVARGTIRLLLGLQRGGRSAGGYKVPIAICCRVRRTGTERGWVDGFRGHAETVAPLVRSITREPPQFFGKNPVGAGIRVISEALWWIDRTKFGKDCCKPSVCSRVSFVA